MVTLEDAIPLREYIEHRFAALAEDTERRFIDAQRAVDKAFDAVNKTNDIHADAHKREHVAYDQAIQKAEESVNQRLLAMNEFRQQITDERGAYMTKAEFQRVEESWQRQYNELSKSVDLHTNQFAGISGKQGGITTTVGWMLGVATLVLAVVVFAVNLALR